MDDLMTSDEYIRSRMPHATVIEVRAELRSEPAALARLSAAGTLLGGRVQCAVCAVRVCASVVQCAPSRPVASRRVALCSAAQQTRARSPRPHCARPLRTGAARGQAQAVAARAAAERDVQRGGRGRLAAQPAVGSGAGKRRCRRAYRSGPGVRGGHGGGSAGGGGGGSALVGGGRGGGRRRRWRDERVGVCVCRRPCPGPDPAALGTRQAVPKAAALSMWHVSGGCSSQQP